MTFMLFEFLFIISSLFSMAKGLPQQENSVVSGLNQLEGVTSSNTIQAKIIGVVSIICGLILAFSGYRLFEAALFLAGLIFFSDLTYLILLRCEPSQGYGHRELILILVPLAVGILGGFLARKLWKFGLSILGFLGGATLAVLLLNCGLKNTITSDLGRLALILVIAIIAGCLIHLFEKPAIITCTSFLGSYTAIIGLDCFLQTKFNTALQMVLFQGKDFSSTISSGEIGMIIGVVVLSLIGMAVQFNFTKDQDDHHRRKH